MTNTQTVIERTNNRIGAWYINAKKDFNVVGSGTCKIEGNEFIVNFIENGVSKEWKMAFYPEYLENGVDYLFNCWAEGAK